MRVPASLYRRFWPLLLACTALAFRIDARRSVGAEGAGEKNAPPPVSRGTRPVPSSAARLVPQSTPPGLRVRNIVVNNTDPVLQNTENWGDGEPSIAVDPTDPNRIVITAFSGGWQDFGPRAPLWVSTDAGATWTKRLTLPAVNLPYQFSGPWDQTVEFSRDGTLFCATLVSAAHTQRNNIFTGGSDRDHLGEILFPQGASLTPATNLNSESEGNADQPWIVTGRAPAPQGGDGNRPAGPDNVYVGYVDTARDPEAMRVSVAAATVPPHFTSDVRIAGGGGGNLDAGLRLAVDPRNGWIYAGFQRGTDLGDRYIRQVTYVLSRSRDGGKTWELNGNSEGMEVATRKSQQGYDGYKFGHVNALIGGVLHLAVDPENGDVYYALGDRDAGGNNRLKLVTLHPDDTGRMSVIGETSITASSRVQAALPAVAVTRSGAVGVLYDTWDGYDEDNYPVFSAHLAVSTDHGHTFQDLILLTFPSADYPDSDSRQRVLGDYQQLKALGETFYGVFTATPVNTTRKYYNMDPVFFSYSPARQTALPGTGKRAGQIAGQPERARVADRLRER